MNYYQPRELRTGAGDPTGLWHYTRRNDNQIWPVGYCRDQCPGHPSADEAVEHYRQYLLDEELRLDGRLHAEQRPCAVCAAWTQGLATLGEIAVLVLCDDHRTRETVDQLFRFGGVIISSF